MRRLLGLVVLVAVLTPVLFQPGGVAAEEAGWYGPFDDGCYYYWDGYAWTGDKDCSQSTYQFAAAGWYGPFSDGCNYWWDGAQYTGDKDCPQQTWAAGWYLLQDGCQWYYDGTQYTGQSSCPSGQVAGAGTTSMAAGAGTSGGTVTFCISGCGAATAGAPDVCGLGGSCTVTLGGATSNPTVTTTGAVHTQTTCGLGGSCTVTLGNTVDPNSVNGSLLQLTALIHAQGGGDHMTCQLLHDEPDRNGDGRPDERDEYCRERYG